MTSTQQTQQPEPGREGGSTAPRHYQKELEPDATSISFSSAHTRTPAVTRGKTGIFGTSGPTRSRFEGQRSPGGRR